MLTIKSANINISIYNKLQKGNREVKRVMKSKRILSSLIALSIIATSSLAFEMTAKAAPSNSTSNKAANLSSSKGNLHSNITLHGGIYWSTVRGSSSYSVRLERKISDRVYVKVAGHNEREGLKKMWDISKYVTTPDYYRATVSAEGDGGTIVEEKLEFYYDGDTFHKI